MKFSEYLVTGSAIEIKPGQFVKGLTDEQLKRRKRHVKRVKESDVFECVRAFRFKVGEKVFLQDGVYNKAFLMNVEKPGEVVEDPEEQPEPEEAEKPVEPEKLGGAPKPKKAGRPKKA